MPYSLLGHRFPPPRAVYNNDFTPRATRALNLGEERDRVACISEAALRAGVQERAIRLAEQYGQAIAKMLEQVFDGLELEFEFDNGGIPHEVKKKIVLQALSVVDPDGGTEQPAVAAGDEG